jgi:NhaP-type Na+/H+ or K+/H+ antiporter
LAAVEGAHPAFTLVLALAMGVLAQSIARHVHVPGIVLLLMAGAGLGPDGLGWIHPKALGEGLFSIVHLAVAVILFEGGLNLEMSRLRREQAAIRRLVTWGALVTFAGGAITVHLLLDWGLIQSLLFGSLVVVTGPTVVGPLLNDLRLRPRAATVLEAEGVLIDPVGAILAVLILEIAVAPGGETLAESATQLLFRIGFGAGVGALAGFALASVLRLRRVVPEGYENIFVLASVLLLFQGCDEVVSESGILAVTIAGVVVGNLRSRVDRDLREFKDQLTVLMIGLLFVLLAADVRIEEVLSLGWRGVGVVAVLLFIVRPLGVWLCTQGSELRPRERGFIGWIAPRGIVAAAIASVTATALDSAGIEGGTEVRALVFLTIAITVVLAGLTAAPIAALLGIRQPGRDTVAILGASGLGLGLGEALERAGRPVVMLDSNPQNCRTAEEAGLPVVFGNAVQERTMLRARFGNVGEAVGVTANQALNSVFATRARSLFRVPDCFIAVSQPGAGMAMELVDDGDARLLFDGVHDVERWDVRWRRKELSVEHWRFEAEPERAEDEAAPVIGELLVMLIVRRGGRTRPMRADHAFKKGDEIAAAIYTPDREEALRVLGALGFVPVIEVAEAPEDVDESLAEATPA